MGDAVWWGPPAAPWAGRNEKAEVGVPRSPGEEPAFPLDGSPGHLPWCPGSHLLSALGNPRWGQRGASGHHIELGVN